jgi:riboflavin synthase
VSGPPHGGLLDVVAVAETLRRTTFGSLRPGAVLQLEPPLRLGDPLGGHWVNGHVDVTAAIHGIHRDGREFVFTIALPEAIAPYVVEKGSIAVDGVSLTVGAVGASDFRVYIIPETRARTLFGRYHAGDVVNLEADVLAKYVERILLTRGAERSGLAGAKEPPPSASAARRILEEWERGGS